MPKNVEEEAIASVEPGDLARELGWAGHNYFFGPGSGLDPDSNRSVDLDSESESGSWRAGGPTKI
jgi:hypothetical protein